MVPLVVLIVTTLLARLMGRFGLVPVRSWAAATRVGLAIMLFFTAAAHFNSMRADLIRMVPPGFPNPELLVTLTGLCEIFGGLGLLLPRTRRVAAVALIVFLFAVLPANIHAALSGLTLRGAPATPLVPRIALQLLFVGLVWWSGIHATKGRVSERGWRPSERAASESC
jgi:uncharacterized membrane protein